MQKFAEAGIAAAVAHEYFGEVMDHDCGNCDVCLDPPSRALTAAWLVQKAGSAIIRTDQKRLEYWILTDILRGSSRAEIRQKGLRPHKDLRGGARPVDAGMETHT